jgi:hypothetical protein
MPKLHSSLRLAAETSKPVFLTATDYTRVAELAGTYRDLPLGTTDASLVALAERLNLSEVATHSCLRHGESADLGCPFGCAMGRPTGRLSGRDTPQAQIPP